MKVGAVRVTRNNDVVSASGILKVEECISDIRNALNRNIFDLKITPVINPVRMIQDAFLSISAHCRT